MKKYLCFFQLCPKLTPHVEFTYDNIFQVIKWWEFWKKSQKYMFVMRVEM